MSDEVEYTKTIYKSQGKVLFEDADNAYEIEEIRRHYAAHDKTLVQASYAVNVVGDVRTVEFAKKTGTKGMTDD